MAEELTAALVRAERARAERARARTAALNRTLRVRVAGLEAALRLARAEADLLRQSRIWRATAPLRWLRNFLVPPRQGRAAGGGDAGHYARWIAAQETLDAADCGAIAAHVAEWTEPPHISVLMPVHDPDPAELQAAVGSVLAGLYPHWELILADDGSRRAGTDALLAAQLARDGRIRLVRLQSNRGIAAATNAGLAQARGEFVALLDQDDLLAPTALYEVACTIERAPDMDAFYSDEDHLAADGRRAMPYFKPDFSIELLRGHNLVSHLGVYRRRVLEDLGGLREGFEGSQDYDLALRFADRVGDGRIQHIPWVLYHWRQRAGQYSRTREANCVDSARRAIEQHLVRRGEAGTVVPLPEVPSWHRVVLALPADPPRVTVMIPTRDAAELLRRSCFGVLRETEYPDLEVLVLDNGSSDADACALLAEIRMDTRVRVLDLPGPFNFSALNNAGAAVATGSVLVLLNNDIEIIGPDWLHALVAQAIRPGVGAVGARLLYPDGRIQHAGVALGVMGVAGHCGLFEPGDGPGYFGTHALARQVGAVTAACLAVQTAHWRMVGGMDAAGLAVAFNDVDFCLRLGARGLRTIYEPQATLIHHESATRGHDLAPEHRDRFAREVALMRERWGQVLDQDPFYSPSFSRTSGNFELDPANPRPRSWE